jgi:hypothetical protein
MHRGSDYQAGVAAWLAVEMLAEGQGGPLSPGGRITLLRGETQESMDDLLVGTASGRYGFIQAKSKVVFSDKPDGEFASVIDQAVRQVADRDDAGITRPWGRPLSPSTDRLLLVTGSSIREQDQRSASRRAEPCQRSRSRSTVERLGGH